MKRQLLISLMTAGCMFLFTGCSNERVKKLEMSRADGISYMQNGQYEEAIPSFESAFSFCDEKMPETKTDILLYEATCKFNLEDYEGLKSVCDRIIELGDSAEAYYLKGTAELKLGNEAGAAAAFDEASEINPNDYEMLLNIYRQYEQISQSAVGDIYIQKALQIPNSTMEDYYQKGCIYYYLKDYNKALEALAEPVQEKNEMATLLMGETYLEKGDSTSARNTFQKYMEEFGASATVYNGLALCDLADKAYSTALEDIQNGLQGEVSDELKRELLYNEIVAYEMKDDFATAKTKAEAFTELYPDDEDGQREYAFLSTR